ncbi:tumor necrosis factor receptor superfamily member 14-like [Pundamilia nyererei]|uniref:Tumor necrosis factor receptor superfamily member 14-like n=1 Tax=Pundamilia nyererei TaxID=303518 RepID=A0A3B4G3A6_9CICH|nr:PREDICTED: tumor necrosis factor receptor superfamily member 14-like [Pundamilia nyererei]XP_005748498.1 PREDICTED: tumor necrosis factor receptor superfamily member 14-like [Pundamilia nyererei]XP_005748499.1 PREDICTED: tumor necrosis factor receptor superfamily member 14-like [Pundamilia nyererei]
MCPVTENRTASLKRTKSLQDLINFDRGQGPATAERDRFRLLDQGNFEPARSDVSKRKPVNVAAFLVILIILMKVSSVLSLTCHQAEYQIGNECCPKCLAGSRVKMHCNEYRSTSCLPCMDGTFTDQPNGLERCIPCTNCDSALGLRVNKQCTTTSDTVCEPLEGFHCVSFVRLSCDIAQKHKRCKPGQYISQKGTASTDTECSDCSSGTFSNGTFHSCQPHTQCHLFNLQLVTAGTSAADAQCGEHSFNVGAAVGVAVCVLIVITGGGGLLLWHLKKRAPSNRPPIKEQGTDGERLAMASSEGDKRANADHNEGIPL